MYSLQILSFLLLGYSVPFTNGQCDSGWTYYTETQKCFHVENITTTRQNHLLKCQSYNGTLAIIKSQQENDFVTNYTSKIIGDSTTVTKYAYIGLSKASSTDSWTWVDSSSSVSYTNWQPNQPDESTYPSSATLVPVVSSSAQTNMGWKKGAWDDQLPSNNQYAICQKMPKCDGYILRSNISGAGFFDNFMFKNFVNVEGKNFVVYADRMEAFSKGFVSMVNGQAKIWCDHTSVVLSTEAARKAVWIETPLTTAGPYFTGGLVLLDFTHMPVGKGTWPAFWLSGHCTDGWPHCGEIDIIEGGDGQTANEMTGHTDAGCTMPQSDQGTYYSGTWLSDGHCDSSGGCTIKGAEGTFGPSVNTLNGGVYATEYENSSYFKIWWFPRASIPADIKAGNPKPCTWGKPASMFRLGPNCPSSHFQNMRIIFTNNFCGMASKYFSGATSEESQANCEQYVRNNPQAYENAYWLVNSLKVFTR